MKPGNWRAVLSIQAVTSQAFWVGVRLMIGYRALDAGAEPLFLGFLAASFALPALLAALPAGRLSDRRGGTPLVVAGMLVSLAGSGVALLSAGLPVLLAASAAIGLGQLLVMVGQQTFVAHVGRAGSADGSTDSAFGTLTAAASVGQLLGPPVITTIATAGAATAHPDTTLGLLACAGFLLLSLPLPFLLRATDRSLRAGRPPAAPDPASAASLLRTKGLWRSLAVSGAVLVTVDLMYTFVPAWATEQGISATAVGYLLALRAAVSVVSRIGLTRLVDRFGRKFLLIASIAAAAIGLLALPLVGMPGAVAVMVGLGLGLGIPQPLTMAWVVALAEPSRHGAALGLRMTVNRFAQITLPVTVGAFAAPLGMLGIFWANSALLAAAIAVVVGSNPDLPPREIPLADEPEP